MLSLPIRLTPTLLDKGFLTDLKHRSILCGHFHLDTLDSLN